MPISCCGVKGEPPAARPVSGAACSNHTLKKLTIKMSRPFYRNGEQEQGQDSQKETFGGAGQGV